LASGSRPKSRSRTLRISTAATTFCAADISWGRHRSHRHAVQQNSSSTRSSLRCSSPSSHWGSGIRDELRIAALVADTVTKVQRASSSRTFGSWCRDLRGIVSTRRC